MREAWVWLAEGLGYSAPNSGFVLENLPGGAAELAQQMQHYPQDADMLTPAQRARLERNRPEDYADLVRKCDRLGVQLIGYADSDYPELLRQIHNPPPVLYLKGDAKWLNGYLYIAMVGARNHSDYGADAVRRLGRGVAAAGAVIVSGLAAGLDSEAHKAALAENAPTIACVALGLDKCYPAANRTLMDVITRHGAVVSEYPPGEHGRRAYFLQRNRIIAGLSHGLVVAEAAARSGTMSTVNFAQDCGRDVFAVPGSIFSELSEGTHAMLREGAYMAASAQDILDVFVGAPNLRRPPRGAEAKTQEKPPEEITAAKAHTAALGALDETAKRVYACLGEQPVSLAALCDETGLAPGAAMAALTELELAGVSRQLAGRRFTLA